MDKIFTKDEIASLLGKGSFWNPTKLAGKTGYITGIPIFDSILEGKLFTEAIALMNLNVLPNGLQIELLKGFKYYSVGLEKASINSIVLEDKEQIYTHQEKSVIGRAVAGGLLAGPAGMVIGGMTGVGTKQVKEKMPDLFITINYTLGGENKVIILSCQYKDKKEVSAFFEKAYKAYWQVEKA